MQPSPPPRPAAQKLRVVIHIGPQKTGTTYLQRRLQHVRKRLEKSGIICHLPHDSERGLPGGARHRLAGMLIDGSAGAFAQEVAEIRAQGWHCLLISSESLARRTRAQLAPLAEIFAPDQVEIYAYCRRWSDRLPSHWWQNIATGGTVPFPDWFGTVVNGGTGNSILNESLIWRNWAELFGRAAVHLISYDALRQREIDIADDFLHTRLHWPGKFHQPPPRKEVRKTPSPVEIEITRCLNLQAAAHGKALPGHRRRALLEALRVADFQPFRDMAGDAMQVIPINDADPSFVASRVAMQAWEDRLVTRTLSPNIVMPRATAYSFVPPEALNTAAASAAFGDLLKSA